MTIHYALLSSDKKQSSVGTLYPSLNLLICKCCDFVNELTMPQFIWANLGIVIDRTPQCTPEIAGEGVE